MINLKSVTISFVGLCLFVQPVLVSQPRTASAEVLIQKLDGVRLNRLLAKRNRKALVLNVWATWCVPCVEEFSALSRIAERYGSKGVEVVAVSIDVPEDLRDKVIPFVRRQSGRIRYYINAFEKDEQFIDRLDKDWSGAIPATFIFDAKGRQKKLLLGKQTESSFAKSLDSLLAR